METLSNPDPKGIEFDSFRNLNFKYTECGIFNKLGLNCGEFAIIKRCFLLEILLFTFYNNQ
jgi:hypothetical protein